MAAFQFSRVELALHHDRFAHRCAAPQQLGHLHPLDALARSLAPGHDQVAQTMGNFFVERVAHYWGHIGGVARFGQNLL
jgi:hypothetical protein